MTFIHHLNRFLSRLLSLVNILAIAPMTALVFAASKDQLQGQIASMDVVILLSIVMAIAVVAFVHGTIATLINTEDHLRKLRASMAGADPAVMPEPVVLPEPAASKPAESKPAEIKPSSKHQSGKKRAKGSPKSKTKPAPTGSPKRISKRTSKGTHTA
ncbi:MAG: hypothetical protein J4F41_07190 [Alphaproteobacteria bacterium]|nr:hypothetical protein [Alphaproteobacteria bacterium]